MYDDDYSCDADIFLPLILGDSSVFLQESFRSDSHHLQQSWTMPLNYHLEKIMLNLQGYSVQLRESINRLEKQQGEIIDVLDFEETFKSQSLER